jgi:hypothetical protein
MIAYDPDNKMYAYVLDLKRISSAEELMSLPRQERTTGS